MASRRDMRKNPYPYGKTLTSDSYGLQFDVLAKSRLGDTRMRAPFLCIAAKWKYLCSQSLYPICEFRSWISVGNGSPNLAAFSAYLSLGIYSNANKWEYRQSANFGSRYMANPLNAESTFAKLFSGMFSNNRFM